LRGHGHVAPGGKRYTATAASRMIAAQLAHLGLPIAAVFMTAVVLCLVV
jgi:hypothetical protein